MGKDLAGDFEAARKVFRQGNQILGFDIEKLCFEGPETELIRTENAQPAIFLVSMAAMEIFRNLHADKKISAVCGLSSGEFSALAACGSLSFSEALKLVRTRGQWMSAAAEKRPGTMASIIGLTHDECLRVCTSSGAELANINSPTQIVISGSRDAVARAAEEAKKMGAKKVIPLKVSGAFHSSLMQDAQQGFENALRHVSISKPSNGIHFIANVTGNAVADPESIRTGLAKQLVSPVQWVRSVQTVISLGILESLEIGPGTVLQCLAKRIDPAIRVSPWGTCSDIQNNNHHPAMTT